MSSVTTQVGPAATPAPPGGAPRRPQRRIDPGTVRWFAGRLLMSILAVFVVMTAVFLVTRLVSNPAQRLLPIGSSQEQIDALNARLGLDDPLIEQYIRFIGNMFRLDFGDSFYEYRPAIEVVMERLPATLTLAAIAMLISVFLFMPMGIIASLRPGSVVDRLVTGLSLAGLSMPQFWLGTMLVLIFSVGLGWFPTSGSGSLIYAVLPAFTLAFTMGGRLAQVTRTAFLDQGRMPYVEMATAKGFSRSYVLGRHVLRNAALPMVTIALWDLTRAITGHTVVVEVVFAWPGFGSLIIEAVRHQDFPIIEACVFVGACIIVILNLAGDVLARIIEPRVVTQ